MGYRCRWLATRALDRTAVLTRLGLSVTEELNEEVYDPGLYGVDVDGWFVVFGDGWDFMRLVEPEQARALSSAGEVLYLFTDDTPMCAQLTSYAGGAERWSIVYTGTDEVAEPQLTGPVPDPANTILAELRKEQAAQGSEVDCMYELVPKLAQALVGFRHDETLSEGAHLPVRVLAAATAA